MFSRSSKQAIETLIQAGYRYAYALQNDSGEAQGLVHDAWLRASKAKGKTPDRALLFRCVRNIHIDQYRRSRTVQFNSADEFGRAAADQIGAIDVAEIPDAQLQSALKRLKENEREVLFLSVVEGYTAGEIAELTESTRGTVLSLIHRARLKLRNLMTEDNVSPFVSKTGRVTND